MDEEVEDSLDRKSFLTFNLDASEEETRQLGITRTDRLRSFQTSTLYISSITLVSIIIIIINFIYIASFHIKTCSRRFTLDIKIHFVKEVCLKARLK